MLGWSLYHAGLVLGGIIWVCVASTLCGCAQSNAWVSNQSGQWAFNQGNYTAARHEFERALADDPYNPSYAYNVARAMEKQGETQHSERMYQHALTIDPTHQPSYHRLSELLIDQGREGDAHLLVQAWADTQPYIP